MMRLNNKIQVWTPIPDIPKKLLVKSLVDDFDGFKVLLYEEGQEIENPATIFTIKFISHLAYRNLDESFHLRTWDENEFPLNGGSLYRTDRGDFIDSFNHLSYGIYKDRLMNHIITTSNDVLEVITFIDAEIIATAESTST